MSIRKSARRRARELALQGLYGYFIASDGAEIGLIEANLRDLEGYDKADQKLLSELLHGVVKEHSTLRTDIEPYLDRPIKELSPIEYSVLMIAAYELKNCLDVPYRVVINEAVEMTKEFGGTDGFKFVNGVLDKLAAQLRSVEVEGGR
ncbi:Transcription antitermination protein NusB [Oligella sp. MSHR50489EDL]|uniref:transcription antitermination factor NusB n=1 Tax=Oligella sp. MSHR50489EDL TaxID=3139409 RepID=UPI003D813B6D